MRNPHLATLLPALTWIEQALDVPTPPCGQGCTCPQCLADLREEQEQDDRFAEVDESFEDHLRRMAALVPYAHQPSLFEE